MLAGVLAAGVEVVVVRGGPPPSVRLSAGYPLAAASPVSGPLCVGDKKLRVSRFGPYPSAG